MKKRIQFITIFLSVIFFISETSFSQAPSEESKVSRDGAVKVFMDCRCDLNYIREEIPYINYVRDVREAQVYVLVTRQMTGSGGEQFKFAFQGLKEFEGLNDTLVYSSNPDETYALVREEQTKILKMGLLRYVARTPIRSEVEISHNENLKAEEVIDKWNHWVFDLQTSPRLNAEETYKAINLFNSINISKVTPDLKLDIGFFQSYNKQRYIEDNVENTYIRKSETADILFVKSLNNHWSAGLKWNLRGSTQANFNLNHEVMPAIEYDLYPYSEASHRQLRTLYSIGYQYSDYIDTTIYNVLKENLFRHELRIAYQIQEKWGSINVSLSGSSYLHDFSKNSVEINGYLRIRVFKGLSISLNGQAAYINDRLNQRKGELSEAERLLRLKQQATSFEIGSSLSINYTFGSIYSNVVNPRFNNY